MHRVVGNSKMKKLAQHRDAWRATSHDADHHHDMMHHTMLRHTTYGEKN